MTTLTVAQKPTDAQDTTFSVSAFNALGGSGYFNLQVPRNMSTGELLPLCEREIHKMQAEFSVSQGEQPKKWHCAIYNMDGVGMSTRFPDRKVTIKNSLPDSPESSKTFLALPVWQFARQGSSLSWISYCGLPPREEPVSTQA